MGQLDGKVAVITGGSRGLGLGIARAYAQAGAQVAIASRSKKSIDEAVQLIQSEGGQVTGITADVSDLNEINQLAEHAISQFGKMDIWVNNAGIAGPYGATMGFDPEDFTKVVKTNILGVYFGSRTAMNYFIAQGSGKLINILGHGYNRPLPWQNSYGSSKTWIRNFTKALALETKESNVSVFAFNPGLVLTELLTDVEVVEGSEERLKNFPVIIRMWAKPPEIPAQKMVWIASSATDGKTGQLFNIFSTWAMLSGAIKEGWRALLHKPAADLNIRTKTIPFYKG